jgi:hypothetical protein
VDGVLVIDPIDGAATVGPNVSANFGQLTVGPGGTLQGNGLIFATVPGAGTTGGVIQFDDSRIFPGFSPGTLTIDGNYDQRGGLLGIEIAGTAPGQFDVLAVTGNATLAGALLLEFVDGFAPRQGDEFKFLDVGGALSGAFANIEVRNLLPGFQFDLRNDGGGLTMVALNDGVSVPDPATLAILFAGIFATLYCRGVQRSACHRS